MTIRFAYNTNGAANHRLDDAIHLIADAGYQGVALTLDHHHLDPFAENWRQEAERIGLLLRARGLGSVIETGARYLLNPRDKHEPTLVSATPEGRLRRIVFLARAAEIAAIIGSETVSFWAGVPKPGIPREEALDWLDQGLAEVCNAGERAGIPMSLEPEPGMLVETAADYERLRVFHPGLRLALDTGHCLVTQDLDPAEAVRRYASRLGTIAIEDMRRGEHVHLPFGQGDMDVAAVLAAIEEIGFPGLVCVELSRESPRAHQAIPEAIAYLKACRA